VKTFQKTLLVFCACVLALLLGFSMCYTEGCAPSQQQIKDQKIKKELDEYYEHLDNPPDGDLQDMYGE
jgi:hypothetical protein